MVLNNTIRVHLICWIVYITYEILLIGTLNGYYSHFLTYFLFYLMEIGLFYFHALFLMPRLLGPQKIKILFNFSLLVIVLVIYLGGLIGVSYFLDYIGLRNSPLTVNRTFILTLVWRAILFLMYASGYFFLNRFIQQTKKQSERSLELARMKTKMLQLESDYLRSQISPHLLFNTLNFIKFAAKHKPHQSEEAIMLLTETLDFSLSKSKDGLIYLHEELRQVNNIIRINQLRFNEKLHITYHLDPISESIKVLPISILSIVENLFKHGDLLKKDHPATIIIIKAPHNLVIKTENLITNNSNSNLQGKGSGLSNLHERLYEIYGEKGFSLKHGKDGILFKLELIIPIVSV